MKKYHVVNALASLLLAALPALSAPTNLYNQAVADYNSGKYRQAATAFETIKEASPSNAMNHYYLALCRQALGQYNKAILEYQWVSQNGDARLKGLAVQGLSRMSGVKTAVAASGLTPRTTSEPLSIAAGQARSNRPPAVAKVKKVIKFTAAWCVNCKTFAPIFESTKRKFGGDIAFQVVDVDRDPKTAVRYEVSGLPYVVFVDSGDNVIYRNGSFPDESSFAEAIQRFR